ncbi:MAG: dCTP deaminase [Candidatus Helarchaeota archaeon]
MAILSNGILKELIKGETPLIICEDKEHPFDANLQIQAASIDLRLSNVFFKYKKDIQYIDILMKQERDIERFELKENEPLIILPEEIINGQTIEIINLNNRICARVEMRSSLARLGLITHFASYMNPGYRGPVPLQIKNILDKPIVIRPYIRICTVIFEELREPCEVAYDKRFDAKYKNEKLISPSKLYLDQDMIEKIVSENELNKFLENRVNDYNLIELIKENSNLIKNIVAEIYSEALYISKYKNKDKIDEEDIRQATNNIKKIYKYISESIVR